MYKLWTTFTFSFSVSAAKGDKGDRGDAGLPGTPGTALSLHLCSSHMHRD